MGRLCRFQNPPSITEPLASITVHRIQSRLQPLRRHVDGRRRPGSPSTPRRYLCSPRFHRPWIRSRELPVMTQIRDRDSRKWGFLDNPVNTSLASEWKKYPNNLKLVINYKDLYSKRISKKKIANFLEINNEEFLKKFPKHKRYNKNKINIITIDWFVEILKSWVFMNMEFRKGQEPTDSDSYFEMTNQ